MTLIGEEFLFLSSDDHEAASAVEKFGNLQLETGENP